MIFSSRTINAQRRRRKENKRDKRKYRILSVLRGFLTESMGMYCLGVSNRALMRWKMKMGLKILVLKKALWHVRSQLVHKARAIAYASLCARQNRSKHSVYAMDQLEEASYMCMVMDKPYGCLGGCKCLMLQLKAATVGVQNLHSTYRMWSTME